MQIKDEAKTILCYGDSNTWGKVPKGDRYPRSIRWTGVLQYNLGETYEVIEAGLSGRTFVVEDPNKPWRTGITHLKSIVLTHDPIDQVVVMLGTNDIKNQYNLTVDDIGNHLRQTLDILKGEGINNVIIICPPEFVLNSDGVIDERFTHGVEIMKALPDKFAQICNEYGYEFINAQNHISSSSIDGFHLDPESHKKLGEIIAGRVKNLT